MLLTAGGFPPPLADSVALVNHYLDLLEADYALVLAHSFDVTPSDLNAVCALATDDPWLDEGAASFWSSVLPRARVEHFTGGHFFPSQDIEQGRRLAQELAHLPHATTSPLSKESL